MSTIAEGKTLKVVLNIANKIIQAKGVCRNDIATYTAAMESFPNGLENLPINSFTSLPSTINYDAALENIFSATFDLLVRMVKAIFDTLVKSIDWIIEKIKELFGIKTKVKDISIKTENVKMLVDTVKLHLEKDMDKLLDDKAVNIIKQGLIEIKDQELASVIESWTSLDDLILINTARGDGVVKGISKSFGALLEFTNTSVASLTSISESMHAAQSLNSVKISDMWDISNSQTNFRAAPELESYATEISGDWRTDQDKTLIDLCTSVVKGHLFNLSIDKNRNVTMMEYDRGLNRVKTVIDELDSNISIASLVKMKDGLKKSRTSLLTGLKNLRNTNEQDLVEQYKIMILRIESLSNAVISLSESQKIIVSTIMNTVHSASSFNRQKITLCDDAIRLRGLSEDAKKELQAMRKAI